MTILKRVTILSAALILAAAASGPPAAVQNSRGEDAPPARVADPAHATGARTPIAVRTSRRTPRAVEVVQGRPVGNRARGASSSPRSSAMTMSDTTLIADFTFDDIGGNPDPQGWVTVDLTQQAGTFFHVDDFAGVPGYAPIAGSKSLWCGVGPGEPGFVTAPGYGHRWDQRFESVSFPAVGTANVSFTIRYDTEPGMDFMTFEYLSATSGKWEVLAVYDGQGNSVENLSVPAVEHGGNLNLRFHFTSDDLWDDEDGLWDTNGAVVIDDILVTSGAGVHDSENFEGEAVGALGTTDGYWQATVRAPFGDYAGLVDGQAVLQEDTTFTNNTNFWAFFNGSPDTYACGGFPGQPAVPMTSNPGSSNPDDYIANEIRSPWIDITQDVNGMPYTMTDNLWLAFDVYRDLPLDNLIFYDFRVRWMVGGQPTAWFDDSSMNNGDDKMWLRHGGSLAEYVVPGATHIQVGLQVVDVCWFYCGILGSGACHSHAPLIDNVSILHIDEGPLVVTNTNDSGPGSLRDAIEIASASVYPSTIQFDIPGAGPHVIAPTSQLPNLGENTTLDGTTQPGYAGGPLIEIDGVATVGARGLGTAGGCVIRGLSIYGFDDEAVRMSNDGNRIESSYLGQHSDGSFGGNDGNGVFISGSNNVVGGESAALGNRIAHCFAAGVYVSLGTGNAIRMNAIYSNSGLGIDLNPVGAATNDPLDADVGANDLQNFPVVTGVDIIARTVQGTLHSKPNQSFTIDIYASDRCPGFGQGQAEVYLGTVNAATDGSGNAIFSAPITNVPYGSSVNATATNTGGSTSEFASCFVTPTPLVVTNTEYFGTGPGRLRDAVTTANATPGVDIIVFDIPGPGPHAVQWSAGSIGLTDVVVIDGFTQPGASPNTNPIDQPCNAVLQISLASGFSVSGGNTLIRGLAIADGNHQNVGLHTLGNNRVEGCFIGTDVTGTSAIANIYSGVLAASSGNVVGGPLPEQRNIIAGQVDGVFLSGTGSTLNKVQGNFIGTDITGTVPLGNGNGVRITGTDNLVGGTVAAERNVIFATNHGVDLTVEEADNNTVSGNFIGLDRTGTVMLGAVPSGATSIAILNGDYNTIGGASVDERNVCAGSGYGMWLLSSSEGNSIINNFFGTDVTGTVVFGFGTVGILATCIGPDNDIGGINPGEGNVFAGSAGDGVIVNGGIVRILGNSFFDNAGLGIDILNDGVTPNDPGDADTGPNELQNFPDISGAELQGGSTMVTGTLTTAPGSYRVEFFASDACDPSGYGEGRNYLGSTDVTTDGAGMGSFDVTLPAQTPDGWWVTGTATDPAGNTSEFSACVQSINTPVGSNVAVTPVDPGSGQSPVTLTFDNITGVGNTTLSTSDTGPPPPNGFTFGDTTRFYDLETDATYSGNIEICIQYDEASLGIPEGSLVLLHYDTTLVPPDWVDVTTSLDTGVNILCGQTMWLSPFAVAGPDQATGIDDRSPSPHVFALYQNVPNPFNPTTVIRYDVPTGGAVVELAIFDVAGRRVRSLVDGFETAGIKHVTWDGRNDRGAHAATGIYFYRMVAGNFVQTRKVLLLK